jgi:hypothetical protein
MQGGECQTQQRGRGLGLSPGVVTGVEVGGGGGAGAGGGGGAVQGVEVVRVVVPVRRWRKGAGMYRTLFCTCIGHYFVRV